MSEKRLYRLYYKENKQTIAWFNDYEDMSYLMDWIDGGEDKTGYEEYELQKVIE
jgi:hypothetical protein